MIHRLLIDAQLVTEVMVSEHSHQLNSDQNLVARELPTAVGELQEECDQEEVVEDPAVSPKPF